MHQGALPPWSPYGAPLMMNCDWQRWPLNSTQTWSRWATILNIWVEGHFVQKLLSGYAITHPRARARTHTHAHQINCSTHTTVISGNYH